MHRSPAEIVLAYRYYFMAETLLGDPTSKELLASIYLDKNSSLYDPQEARRLLNEAGACRAGVGSIIKFISNM